MQLTVMIIIMVVTLPAAVLAWQGCRFAGAHSCLLGESATIRGRKQAGANRESAFLLSSPHCRGRHFTHAILIHRVVIRLSCTYRFSIATTSRALVGIHTCQSVGRTMALLELVHGSFCHIWTTSDSQVATCRTLHPRISFFTCRFSQ